MRNLFSAGLFGVMLLGVSPTLTTITVSGATIQPNGTATITAIAYDQFGVALTFQPTFTWSVVSGSGSIDSSTGLFTAPATREVDIVRATSGSIHGDGHVVVGLGTDQSSSLLLLMD